MDTDILANSLGPALRRRPAGIPVVLQQHAEDAAAFYATRALPVGAPHVKLHHLRRLDDRLAAHLDGLAVTGEDAWPFCEAALESPSSGAVFTAAVRAIGDKRNDRLDRLFALVAAQLRQVVELWHHARVEHPDSSTLLIRRDSNSRSQ